MRVGWLAAGVLALAGSLAAEDAGIVPNENLVVDGIPKLPSSIAEGVGRYTEFRSASFRSWHPTRREMLITTRFADTNQVHLVKAPGGDRRQLTFFPDRVAAALVPAVTASDYFVFAKDKRRRRVLADLPLRPRHGRDHAADRRQALAEPSAPWSHAGDRMAYSSTRRNGRPTGRLRDRIPRTRRATACCSEVQGGGWGPPTGPPTTSRLLAAEGISANESYLWLVDVASGEKRLLTPKGGAEKVSYGGGPFSRDGRASTPPRDKDSEFQRLARIDLATGKHTYLTAGHPLGRRRASTSRRDGQHDRLRHQRGRRRRAASAGHGHARRRSRRPELPLARDRSASRWHQNGRDLAFSQPLGGALALRRLFAGRAEPARSSAGRRARPAACDTRHFAEPRARHAGRASTGARSPASSTARRPASPARARWSSTSTAAPRARRAPASWAANNYLVNELGVAMIFPNVRGSTGYGKTLPQARQRDEARGLREGHRRAARLDQDAARTSTPRASWSPAAATAAT